MRVTLPVVQTETLILLLPVTVKLKRWTLNSKTGKKSIGPPILFSLIIPKLSTAGLTNCFIFLKNTLLFIKITFFGY